MTHQELREKYYFDKVKIGYEPVKHQHPANSPLQACLFISLIYAACLYEQNPDEG